LFTRNQITLFQTIEAEAAALQLPTFVIGGTIRDMLLGTAPIDSDVDLLVEGSAIALAGAVQNQIGGTLREFAQFGTAKLTELSEFGMLEELDFAMARTETYPTAGALPVVTESNIRGDLSRRDFSINAMAVTLQDFIAWCLTSDTQALRSRLIDEHGGAADLESKLVRILHAQSFFDDPTRIFRAARYAARIDGMLELSTAEFAVEAIIRGSLQTLSNERKLTELRKIFKEKSPARTLEILRGLGTFNSFRLWASDKENEVFKLLRRADGVTPRGAAGAFAASMALFFHSFPRTESESIFKSLGFGKKSFRQMDTLPLKAKELAPIEQLSETELWYLVFTCSDASLNECKMELVKRKLCDVVLT